MPRPCGILSPLTIGVKEKESFLKDQKTLLTITYQVRHLTDSSRYKF